MRRGSRPPVDALGAGRLVDYVAVCAERQVGSVPELARDLDHAPDLGQEQRANECRRVYGVAPLAPAAFAALANARRRQDWYAAFVHGLLSIPGKTSSASSGRPEASLQRARSVARGASRGTVRRLPVFSDVITSVRSRTCPQRSVSASWGRSPAWARTEIRVASQRWPARRPTSPPSRTPGATSRPAVRRPERSTGWTRW